MTCAIWYHMYGTNLTNVKNTHGEVLHLVKLRIASPMQSHKNEILTLLIPNSAMYFHTSLDDAYERWRLRSGSTFISCAR